MYLKGFEYISMYSNVLVVYLWYILMYFNFISMYLSVCTIIVIRISPSYSHYNAFTIHTYLYICLFTIHNNSFLNMLYHYTLFSCSHWSVPTFIQSVKILHTNSYFSHLYITPHSTFHDVTSCTEHS
jgi:hypothetical protein